MEEIHRVCADGAIVRITLPYYSRGNAFADPTHRHYFSLFSFHYFTGENDLGFTARTDSEEFGTIFISTPLF